ncbi:hypothetical protein OZ410_13640 [Robiginitalea sp. M366]|uniref:hypothetical protein n=1 Tax=Robiginitalea aestuariiviva TaxID=3036903 RepID=UPI00240DDBC8|nr:hypothetical protein [Robiginitalea aestuariiviva]MDG1573367.1 hypothetical protein [Robiginitalea aestuariiviva]
MITRTLSKSFAPEQVFLGSILFVHFGVYVFNLVMGRLLGADLFADAALVLTLVMGIAFLGLTFQLTMAQVLPQLEEGRREHMIQLLGRRAILAGLVLGFAMIFFAGSLQNFFNAASPYTFVILGFGLPVYLFMCVSRGRQFAGNDLFGLSMSYGTELWSRLLLTLVLLLVAPWDPILILTLGMVLSFVLGLVPIRTRKDPFSAIAFPNLSEVKELNRFLALSLFAQLTQYFINQGDVFFVKHFATNLDASQFMAMKMVSQTIYFIGWGFVAYMLLRNLRQTVTMHERLDLLYRQLGIAAGVFSVLIVGASLFPQHIMNFMLGGAYLDISPLLWKYALGVSLFSLSNIIVYHFVAIRNYIPVVLSCNYGFLQLIFLSTICDTMEEIVNIQIICMAALLIFQIAYLMLFNRSE